MKLKDISKKAVDAMLLEVAASPKPGLVDRLNSGAHKDMDYELFVRSASSFYEELEAMVDAGYHFKGRDYHQLFMQIRSIGIQAENKMFECTKGVNTHKGALFSLGILCCAAGVAERENKSSHIESRLVCDLAARMVEGITRKELVQLREDEALSHGEVLFKKHGITGIRGEAESGFQSVLQFGLPELYKGYNHLSQNDLMLQILLSLMMTVEDSTIVYRHSIETLREVQRLSTEFIREGGMYSRKGLSYICSMDKAFIANGISPGGSADLLGVTLFLAMLEGYNFTSKNVNVAQKRVANFYNYQLNYQ